MLEENKALNWDESAITEDEILANWDVSPDNINIKVFDSIEEVLNERASSLETLVKSDEEPISDSTSVDSDDALQGEKAEALNGKDNINFVSATEIEDYLDVLPSNEVWQDETMPIPNDVLEFVLSLPEANENKGTQPMEVETASDDMSVSSDDVLQDKKEAGAINSSDNINFLSTKEVEEYLDTLPSSEVWQEETMQIPNDELEFVLSLSEDNENKGTQPMEVETDSERLNLTKPGLESRESGVWLESDLTEIGTEVTSPYRSKEKELGDILKEIEKISQMKASFGNNNEIQLEPGSLQQWWNKDASIKDIQEPKDIKKPSFDFSSACSPCFFKPKLKLQGNSDTVQESLSNPEKSKQLLCREQVLEDHCYYRRFS